MLKYKVVDGYKKIGGRWRAIGEVVECSEETAVQLRLEPVAETVVKEADVSQSKKRKEK